jgi:hypothetical protein
MPRPEARGVPGFFAGYSVLDDLIIEKCGGATL